MAAVGLAASWVGMGVGVLATPFLVHGMNSAKTELMRQQYKDLLMAVQRLRGRYRHGPKPERERWLAMRRWRAALHPPGSDRHAQRAARLRRKKRLALDDQGPSALKPPPKRTFSADSDDIDLDELIDRVNSERSLRRSNLHHNHSRNNLQSFGARGRRGSSGSEGAARRARSHVTKVRRQDFKAEYALQPTHPSSSSLMAGHESRASLHVPNVASMHTLSGNSSIGSSLNEAGAIRSLSPRGLRSPVYHPRRRSLSARNSPMLTRATSARRLARGFGSSIGVDEELPQLPPPEMPFTPTLEGLVAAPEASGSIESMPSAMDDVEKVAGFGNDEDDKKPVGKAQVQRLQVVAHDDDLKGLVRSLDSEFDRERVRTEGGTSPPPQGEFTQASIENPRRSEDIEREESTSRGDAESPSRPPLMGPEKPISPSPSGGFLSFFGFGRGTSPQNQTATSIDPALPSPSADGTGRHEYHAGLSPGAHSTGAQSSASLLQPIPRVNTDGSMYRPGSELRSAPGSPCPEIPSDLPASTELSLDHDPTRQETEAGHISRLPSKFGVTRGKKWAIAKRWVDDNEEKEQDLQVKYVDDGEDDEEAEDSWESITVSEGSAADRQDLLDAHRSLEEKYAGALSDVQQQHLAQNNPPDGQPEGENSPIPVVPLTPYDAASVPPLAPVTPQESASIPSAPVVGSFLDTVATPSPAPASQLMKLTPGVGDLGRGVSEARPTLEKH